MDGDKDQPNKKDPLIFEEINDLEGGFEVVRIFESGTISYEYEKRGWLDDHTARLFGCGDAE
ncbi:hypothetical protein GCM10008171_01800 [Methylopila jiangsuensis]|uniref:Uncharacterized protein n=1 Tax=Methylopila jiangsuensis TaxID=586230 RepID=A0A9W6JCT9_9HYPH|nr:hypothetical protein [Methylopila jiangsuensis]MDR6287346.1 hypothetical protein [Methylopila jiangsuensis]GLK74927.1 hypothetical protein GCM10008171_01800 [Methylopila jiangsuensis]